MKTAEEIKQITQQLITGTDFFIVDTQVSKDNTIEILIDSPQGVNIAQCAEINQKLETLLNRETGDFNLTVSSAGIGYPFRVPGQYLKNIGNTVEIKLQDSSVLKGILKTYNEQEIQIECEEKRTIERKKKKEIIKTEKTIPLSDIKQIKDIVVF